MLYFKDNKSITVYFNDGNIAVFESNSPDFNNVVKLAEASNWIKIAVLQNREAAIMNNIDNVVITDDGIKININDSECVELLNDDTNIIKFIKLLKEKGVIDTTITFIKPFLKNMFENTHINAVTEIYDYCKAMDFEITEDGCFLAYKNVRSDLGSIYDNGATKHTIGKYTEVSQFNTDRKSICSNGLHFCSKEYLKLYPGAVTIIVKVNPKDVVSIPIDYDFQKGRCYRYMTIGILGKGGDLSTTNIEALTDNRIKTVKTDKKKMMDKVKSKKEAYRTSSRISETVSLMQSNDNNITKVAAIMNISVETVKRNIRKHKAASKE